MTFIIIVYVSLNISFFRCYIGLDVTIVFAMDFKKKLMVLFMHAQLTVTDNSSLSPDSTYGKGFKLVNFCQ